MSRQVLVSVVIPCFNQGIYLRDAIDSVLRSTLIDYEIIVVDDGSTDEETKTALKWAETRNITVLRQRNSGLSAARNAGIRKAIGKYIVPLDADDLIAPTYLEKAAWILERRSSVGAVTGWLQEFGVSDSAWRPPKPTTVTMREGNCMVVSSMFRKMIWEDIGGYDESQRTGYEDYDFWLSVLERGWEIVQLEEIVMYYRVKPHSMFVDAKAKHEQLMGWIRQRHPTVFDSHQSGNTLFRVSNWIRSTHLGQFLVRHVWRDALVLKEKGFIPWLKWRLFPIAKVIPGFLSAYRAIRGKSFVDGSIYLSKHQEPRRVVFPVISHSGKVNILYIVPWLQMGGADKVNLDILKSLDKRKYHGVVVTTLADNHPWQELFSKHTDDIFHMTSLCSTDEDKLQFLDHIIHSRHIDIIQISNSLAGYQLLPMIKERYRLPVVSLVHTYAPQEPWDYARVSVQYRDFIDTEIAISHRLAKDLERLGWPPKKLAVIENGVDTDIFRPGDADWVQRRFGKKGAVSFIGRLAEEKAPQTFVAVIEELLWRGMFQDILFLIVGGGPLEEQLKKDIRARGLWGHVALVGTRLEHEVVEILRATKVLLAPSQYEGLPMIGLEAMASGVPIVATRVPGWSEVVHHGLNGFLIEPHNIKGMADAVERLLCDTERWKLLSENARRTALERFSLKKMISSYEQIYESLLEKEGKTIGEPTSGVRHHTVL